MKVYKFFLLGAVLISLPFSSGCQKLRARDQLNKGVAAFRNAQFQTAIMHFKTAVGLDPSLLNAKLYLATAYFNQYIPSGESPENLKIAQQAVDAFEDVLKSDPNNSNAIASIAQIYYYEKNFDKSKEYQRRLLQADPNNPVPYYWIGVLDWAICYPRFVQMRRDLKIDYPKDPKDPSSLPPFPAKARAQLEDQNGPLVKEGVEVLEKAVQLKPNDSEAMVYLNLVYRQKADLEPDASAREADLKQAEDWVEKALALRKAGGS
jgi:tetratricopeptide (TPR) repeat protein